MCPANGPSRLAQVVERFADPHPCSPLTSGIAMRYSLAIGVIVSVGAFGCVVGAGVRAEIRPAISGWLTSRNVR